MCGQCAAFVAGNRRAVAINVMIYLHDIHQNRLVILKFNFRSPRLHIYNPEQRRAFMSFWLGAGTS
jgi:hypothetical protein